jgi:hypothetical protein
MPFPTVTLAGDGVTETDATGWGVTVTSVVPVLPSLVAVIVAVPVETPVTTPLEETLATCALLDVNATGRPVRI